MKPAIPFLLAAILALPCLASEPGRMTDDVVLLHAQSRVEVDSEGRVTAVRTPGDLPPAVVAALEEKVRELRFAPPMKDGRAVPGVTYVSQDACAAPHQGAYHFSTRLRGIGPGMEKRVFPAYPRDALRGGVTSAWKLTLAVGADGRATLLQATRTGGAGKYDRDFRQALAEWVAAMQYLPEELDREAVSTTLERNVSFSIEDGRRSFGSSCALALQHGHGVERDVTLDSPFRLQDGD